MLDKLIELLVQFIELFYVWRICDQWERGVVLRFGKFNRLVKPGRLWVWPLGIERVLTEDTYQKVATLPTQSLTTADGKGVVLTPVLTYRVRNAKKVILQAGGHEEAVLAIVPGTVSELVSGGRWADLVTEEWRATVLSACQERAGEWGMQVLDVRFADLVQARTYRLAHAETGGRP